MFDDYHPGIVAGLVGALIAISVQYIFHVIYVFLERHQLVSSMLQFHNNLGSVFEQTMNQKQKNKYDATIKWAKAHDADKEAQAKPISLSWNNVSNLLKLDEIINSPATINVAQLVALVGTGAAKTAADAAERAAEAAERAARTVERAAGAAERAAAVMNERGRQNVLQDIVVAPARLPTPTPLTPTPMGVGPLHTAIPMGEKKEKEEKEKKASLWSSPYGLPPQHRWLSYRQLYPRSSESQQWPNPPSSESWPYPASGESKQWPPPDWLPPQPWLPRLPPYLPSGESKQWDRKWDAVSPSGKWEGQSIDASLGTRISVDPIHTALRIEERKEPSTQEEEEEEASPQEEEEEEEEAEAEAEEEEEEEEEEKEEDEDEEKEEASQKEDYPKRKNEEKKENKKNKMEKGDRKDQEGKKIKKEEKRKEEEAEARKEENEEKTAPYENECKNLLSSSEDPLHTISPSHQEEIHPQGLSRRRRRGGDIREHGHGNEADASAHTHFP